MNVYFSLVLSSVDTVVTSSRRSYTLTIITTLVAIRAISAIL
jgi:hypothetical protein